MTETISSPAPSYLRVVTIPNLLTLGRILTIPFFLAASFRGFYTTAFVLFVSAAVTDIIDGTIARILNQRSRLGAYLDPMADKATMICGYLFYTFNSRVGIRLPEWLTFVILMRDVLIILFAYLLYTRINIRRFPPSYAGKISTLLQAFTLATTIGVNSFVPKLLWLAQLSWRLTALATLVSGLGYVRRASLMLEEPAN